MHSDGRLRRVIFLCFSGFTLLTILPEMKLLLKKTLHFDGRPRKVISMCFSGFTLFMELLGKRGFRISTVHGVLNCVHLLKFINQKIHSSIFSMCDRIYKCYFYYERKSQNVATTQNNSGSDSVA